MEVSFHKLGEVDDALLKYAVIASRFDGKWIYCKHRDRETWEIPGGGREPGEAIADTARRELYEETGATSFDLTQVCVYSVRRELTVRREVDSSTEQAIPHNDNDSFGALYFAEIHELSSIPESEIELIELFNEMPENLTYPEIQPKLMHEILRTPNLL